MQGRPQAITTYRQDQGFELALFLHDINRAETFLALDPGDVVTALEHRRQLRILGGFQRIEGHRILGIGEFAALQIHQLDANGAFEHVFDLRTRHARIAQPGNRQDAALFIQQTVVDLGRFKRHSGTGDEHRAHQADQQGHRQGASGGFFLTRHCVPASA
ncbi:hypothetical protein D9M68_902870 [compost metagenome]